MNIEPVKKNNLTDSVRHQLINYIKDNDKNGIPVSYTHLDVYKRQASSNTLTAKVVCIFLHFLQTITA